MLFPFHFQLEFAVYSQLNVRNVKTCINNKDIRNSYQDEGLFITYVAFFKLKHLQ